MFSLVHDWKSSFLAISFIKSATSTRTFAFRQNNNTPKYLFLPTPFWKNVFQKEAEVDHEAWMVHRGTAKSSVSAHRAELQGQL